MARSRENVDILLKGASHQFLLLELVFRNEQDLPGIVERAIDVSLPHGIEGFRHFYARIGKSRRFLITLVHEPLPMDFSPADASLPFLLKLREKRDAEIWWQSEGGGYLVRYESGLAVSVRRKERGEPDAMRDDEPEPEFREPLHHGPKLQSNFKAERTRWQLIAAVLGLGILLQLGIAAWFEIETRSAEVAVLTEQLAHLRKSGLKGTVSAQARSVPGIQMTASRVEASISSEWLGGYYLTGWSMKDRSLRLEGWGPSAVSLLGALKKTPLLRNLKLESMKTGSGTEFFVFTGDVDNDQP